MIFVGIGQLISGNIIGKVNDSYGGKKVAIAVLTLHILNFGSLIIYNEINRFGFISFVVSFLAGASDSAI